MTLAIQGNRNPFLSKIQPVKPVMAQNQESTKPVQEVASNPNKTKQVQPEKVMDHLNYLAMQNQLALGIGQGAKNSGTIGVETSGSVG